MAYFQRRVIPRSWLKPTKVTSTVLPPPQEMYQPRLVSSAGFLNTITSQPSLFQWDLAGSLKSEARSNQSSLPFVYAETNTLRPEIPEWFWMLNGMMNSINVKSYGEYLCRIMLVERLHINWVVWAAHCYVGLPGKSGDRVRKRDIFIQLVIGYGP